MCVKDVMSRWALDTGISRRRATSVTPHSGERVENRSNTLRAFSNVPSMDNQHTAEPSGLSFSHAVLSMTCAPIIALTPSSTLSGINSVRVGASFRNSKTALSVMTYPLPPARSGKGTR